MEIEHKKCSTCKCHRALDLFLNAKGRRLKTCQLCRDRNKASREKNKCEHNRRRSSCKDCGGVSICEHNRQRDTCKECCGSQICEHKRIRTSCKECGGGAICEHNRHRHQCKDCGGPHICEHNRYRARCKECGGSQICEHKRIKYQCKDCGGVSICEHNRIRSQCKDCGGGTRCEHNRRRSRCKDCGGGSICEHKRERSACKECNPKGHLSMLVRSRCWTALKSKKTKRSIEYVGCTIEDFKTHLESKFTEGMTWETQGKWHIDHIIPLKYGNPSLEETIERLHWTNTQPLWASENMAKGNRYIG